MTIEITETHITDLKHGTPSRAGMAVARCVYPSGEEYFYWGATDKYGDMMSDIPRYLYDAIMRHHREVGA